MKVQPIKKYLSSLNIMKIKLDKFNYKRKLQNWKNRSSQKNKIKVPNKVRNCFRIIISKTVTVKVNIIKSWIKCLRTSNMLYSYKSKRLSRLKYNFKRNREKRNRKRNRKLKNSNNNYNNNKIYKSNNHLKIYDQK